MAKDATGPRHACCSSVRSVLSLLFLAIPLAACGGGGPANEPIGDPTPQELANTIERLAEQQAEEAPKAPPGRLGMLEEAALPQAYREGRTCRLSSGNRLLLIVAAPGALAQLDGKVKQLAVSGPVGPSGGFFETQGASISVGLRAGPGAAAAGTPSTRAGLTVAGEKDRPMERHEGSWICSTPSP